MRCLDGRFPHVVDAESIDSLERGMRLSRGGALYFMGIHPLADSHQHRHYLAKRSTAFCSPPDKIPDQQISIS
jgi:hypothetical protein